MTGTNCVYRSYKRKNKIREVIGGGRMLMGTLGPKMEVSNNPVLLGYVNYGLFIVLYKRIKRSRSLMISSRLSSWTYNNNIKKNIYRCIIS